MDGSGGGVVVGSGGGVVSDGGGDCGDGGGGGNGDDGGVGGDSGGGCVSPNLDIVQPDQKYNDCSFKKIKGPNKLVPL